ncbi:MAG: branched-chain amino acid ABC transporter substrate-binding protein [Nocardiaceae bacterium]|nr:branched-chain amino acid ABC transporter substrate-binding protein [Nocardiaceae bacterium]
MKGAIVVSIAAALAVSGCSSKSNTGGTSGGGSESKLSIQAVGAFDTEGNALKAEAAATPVNPAGDGKAKCKDVAIAMTGALTGDDAALGLNIVNGVRLAVKQHNDANKDCKVELKEFDTEGSADKATQVVPNIINDKTVVGVVGPAFSGETQATGELFSQAGLVSATASATRPTLTDNGWKSFFRGLGSDALQGPAIANYVTKVKGAKKVCVIDDSTPYGTGIADEVKKTLGAANDASCTMQVKKGDKDFSAVVTKMSAAKPDAIFYGGYYAEAAPLLSQLRAGNVEAVFSAGDGVNDPKFVELAGNAAKGAILGCPCGEGPESFQKAYADLAGQEPGVYSAEAYDLATIMLTAIDQGKITRPDMLAFFKGYDGQGLQGTYKWNAKGELEKSGVWMYEVK